MIKRLILTSIFSFSSCITPWKGYKNVEKNEYRHGILVIRETPLYEYPIENKKYQIGKCKEGDFFDVDESYYNKDLTIHNNIATSYYKVKCEKKVGFLPYLGSYSFLNVLEAKSAKELSNVDVNSFKTLSIFQEKISGEPYLTDTKLSFVIYGDFDYLKSARVWLDISDNSDTIYKEQYRITKINSDNTEFTLVSKKNVTIKISRIDERNSKISGVPILKGGKETIVKRYNIIKNWNSYVNP
ncbi:hypothetical protein [Leptospira bandrabouensis]|uniref:hypothetical protein n=1 Tax=Leptospira bandrabouensis TaxID=2484903 RepID=UPI001EE9A734|nr:hypothetical protein [Leptospira bandrabouensis]MCG6146565.1 hypothetical protein [Leptospira bandrabouensis]MCG6161984.1 hypothetical protein [Leptospira bandrabouensis]MCG6166168.1 hypothetical protein [Leptospira bandrabouensis]